MNFAFTDDQLALAATVRDLLAAQGPGLLAERRGPAWARLAELGFFGLLVPAEHDGLGLRLADVVLALEETGRACLPGPVVETAVAAPFLLGGPELGKLATGALCVTLVQPGSGLAVDADVADLVVAWPRAAGRDAVRLTPHPGTDPGRRMFEASFDGEAVLLPGSAVPALRRATVATAAQLVGVARWLLDTSVAYAKVRTQFGRPIGAFQAVKHMLADVAVAVEFAAPLVYRAALAVDCSEATADRDVSGAKAAAGEAAVLAARTALQVHGAVGYTHELDLRHWLARAWSLAAAYGGTAEHRARVREAVAGVPRWP
ncbi:acyl-CoA dehydrogenase family protein [Thermoactinospora rubra]|uniref:acyl-CoA dehydrogenase family protein n=1 Tax=Thermoactinospora rubra TaxID=1088767 RepID=UPI000A11743F|nr:acyl-CoA dehydrogenase family protein [Thermoactinospora rubra]